MSYSTSDPILTRVEADMYDKILTMVQGPYNFTWSCVNEPDAAKQSYPCAEILLIDETNNDDPDGAWSDAYINTATYEIVVKARLVQEVDIPVYAINPELNKALDDLKKLFGINYHIAGCQRIMYKGMRRETERQGDIFVPKRMITTWEVMYIQERDVPTNGADV